MTYAHAYKPFRGKVVHRTSSGQSVSFVACSHHTIAGEKNGNRSTYHDRRIILRRCRKYYFFRSCHEMRFDLLFGKECASRLAYVFSTVHREWDGTRISRVGERDNLTINNECIIIDLDDAILLSMNRIVLELVCHVLS